MNKKIISLLILLIIIMGVFKINDANNKISLTGNQVIQRCEAQIKDLGKINDIQTESIEELRGLITSQTKTIEQLDTQLDYEKDLNKQLVKKYLEVTK